MDRCNNTTNNAEEEQHPQELSPSPPTTNHEEIPTLAPTTDPAVDHINMDENESFGEESEASDPAESSSANEDDFPRSKKKKSGKTRAHSNYSRADLHGMWMETKAELKASAQSATKLHREALKVLSELNKERKSHDVMESKLEKEQKKLEVERSQCEHLKGSIQVMKEKQKFELQTKDLELQSKTNLFRTNLQIKDTGMQALKEKVKELEKTVKLLEAKGVKYDTMIHKQIESNSKIKEKEVASEIKKQEKEDRRGSVKSALFSSRQARGDQYSGERHWGHTDRGNVVNMVKSHGHGMYRAMNDGGNLDRNHSSSSANYDRSHRNSRTQHRSSSSSVRSRSHSRYRYHHRNIDRSSSQQSKKSSPGRSRSDTRRVELVTITIAAAAATSGAAVAVAVAVAVITTFLFTRERVART